jgi:murein DD-endopeptidase MepM/ murein hydrolase activator NlpD
LEWSLRYGFYTPQVSAKLRTNHDKDARMSLNQEEILAQKPPQKFRHSRLRWPLAVAALPFFGVVAAFGIAPDTVPEDVNIERVIEEIALPARVAAVEPNGEHFWREERIRRGDTVSTILVRIGVQDPEALAYLLQARDVRSLYQLVPGRTIRAVTTADGRLERLTYIRTDGKRLAVERTPEGFKATEERPAVERRPTYSSGEIVHSLFGATDAAGLHENVAIQIAEIFSSDIDFHRDLRTGDRFSVVYEANYVDDEFVGIGRVVAAEFINQGRTHRAVFFESDSGGSGYYTPEGDNMRRAFLRSPLEFSRITSGFSHSRFHPVLKTWRSHRGVDYGAPTGTRVRATGNGVVNFAGWKGSYGNVVILRHPNGYTTLYAHLSGFGEGIRRGARVSQGQVIGRVGSTGMATGPHLHYEFHVNGVHRNPLRMAMPPGPPITDELRPAFEQTTLPLLAHLDMLRDTNLAQLD